MQKISAKKRISEALTELIREKNIEDISVSELVEAAGVGKSTFYRYYHDIYNVFEETLDDFAQRIIEVMLYLVFSDKCDEFSKYDKTIPAHTAIALFGLKESDSILVDYLFRTKSIKVFHMVVERFRETVKKYAPEEFFDPEQADYYTRFVMNGILYNSLNDYIEQKIFNMELVYLLRSFSLDSF